MKEAEPVVPRQVQAIGHRGTGLALGAEGTLHHGVAVVGQRPVERNVVLQVEEVVAVVDGHAGGGAVVT